MTQTNGGALIGVGKTDPAVLRGPASCTPTSSGSFISAISSANGSPLWMRCVATPGVDVAASTLTTDGELITAGFYNAGVDFGDGPVPAVAPPDVGMFVARFRSTDGSLVWRRTFLIRNAHGGLVVRLSADAENGHALMVSTDGSVDLGTGALTAGQDVVVSRFDSGGRLLWARALSGFVSGSALTGTAIAAVRPTSDVAVSGSYDRTVNLGCGSGPGSFLARMDGSTGRLAWGRVPQGFFPQSIVASDSGNLALTGPQTGRSDGSGVSAVYVVDGFGNYIWDHWLLDDGSASVLTMGFEADGTLDVGGIGYSAEFPLSAGARPSGAFVVRLAP